MSSGQKPRNPRHFPKMKVRGIRRKRRAPIQLMVGAFDRLGVVAENTARHLEKFTREWNKDVG